MCEVQNRRSRNPVCNFFAMSRSERLFGTVLESALRDGGGVGTVAKFYRVRIVCKYATPYRNTRSATSSCTNTICAATKIGGVPAEYGAAISIFEFSKYRWRLLNRNPPRDISSQDTISSGK